MHPKSSFLSLLLILTLPVFAVPANGSSFEAAAEAYRNRNYAAAYEAFLPLANDGDPRAQTVIAMMYKYGESVSEDQSASYGWYLKAAEAGYAPAMYSVGEMLAEGVGVEADREAAVRWLTLAAESGFERANPRLASLNAEPVADVDKVDESIPWSNRWNFRLPNNVRYGDEATVSPEASYRIQLGAMGTQAAANRLWHLVTTNNQEQFRDYEPLFVHSDETGVRLYRVQTGPFDSFSEARDFCDTLIRRDRRAECIPVESP